MRTIQLIQYNNDKEFTSDYGYYPNPLDIYEVRNMDGEYEVEIEDDLGGTDFEYHGSIVIYRDGRSISRSRHVLDDNEVSYNLLTIVLDDDSELFR